MALSDEILAGPVSVYVAPLATAFPVVNVAPAAAWILLGSQGAKNITEDGVHIFTEDEKAFFRGLGSTGPMKAFRTSEDARVEFELADLNLAMVDKAHGGPATAAGNVVDNAGPPATKELALLRGFTIVQHALLIRKTGENAYGAFNMQWQIPRVVANGQPELVWVKDEPVMGAFSYTLLDDPASGFGKIIAQSA